MRGFILVYFPVPKCLCVLLLPKDVLSRSLSSGLAGNTREGEELDVLWAITTDCQSMGQEQFEG